MDRFTYNYLTINGERSNRLDFVQDLGTDYVIAGEAVYNDIKTGQTSGNYTYNRIGELVEDNPSISGAEKGFEGFKYMIEDPGKNIELMIREMKKPGYFTTYWTLSSYQKGLFDGGSLSGLVEGLPTTILSGLAAKGLGSFGISQTNIRAFGFSANNGRGLLNGPRTIDNYKLDLMYSNPSVGFSSGTFFSIKSLKVGGNMLRWDYGLIHNSSSFGIHSTFRFNINGTTYGSSKQFSKFAPFVFWNYPQK